MPLSLQRLTGPRWQLDIAGHYCRPNVFEQIVQREARPMVRVVDSPSRGHFTPCWILRDSSPGTLPPRPVLEDVT